MHKEKITILFVISANKTNQKGLCPLNCRITLNKERKQFSTGLFVNPLYWENKLQKVKTQDANYKFINAQIEQIQIKINNIALVFQLQGGDCTLENIYNKYIGVEIKKKEFVLSYYKQYLVKIKKLVGLQIKDSTYNKFVYVGNHLEAFLKWKFKKTDYPLEELSLQFLDDFDYYLKTEKKQEQITINKTIQRLRTPIKQAISEGYLDRDPFILHKSKTVRKTVIFLTTEELKTLEEAVLQQKRLSTIQDLFIFCCYTGLAYNEMANLEKQNIQIGFDDMNWIQMKREKTQRQISIPILPKAQEIIEKYSTDSNHIFPTISNQKFNSYLKEISAITGIEKRLTHHIARKTFASTILLYNDVPMEIVSELLGETHNRIKAFFNNFQMFGFTGTPIFADNAVKNELGKRTTKELFGECLHKYVITDAIKDENVLKFSIEYVGRYKQKESATAIDIEVEDIDTKELMEAPKRLEKIADYIIANHNRKTYNKEFTAMFCVSSVDTLIKYYDILQQKKLAGEHNLKIATIFSYAANEDDADANGFIPEELSVVEDPKALYGLNVHTREKLDEFIGHYNGMFETKFSTKDSESFYNYYNDISKKVKERKIDVLLVVNMFLTGFDSKPLNTLYVDKNLKYHGLIQAYSRTNRILNEQKSQGNIIVFRNLKKATDEAITLFSNKEAIEEIIMKPYEDYVSKFNEAFAALLEITPTVNSVNDLRSEEDELEFVKAFRELMRIKNTMATFADFVWEDLEMQEQLFEDYKSKYLDLYDKVKDNHQVEKVSILEDVDFELELIHRDEINVAYILKLLGTLKDNTKEEKEKRQKEIVDLLTGETNLRSKRELIEKFILENLPIIEDTDTIPEEFGKYWNEEQQKAFSQLVNEENLSSAKTHKLIENYLFAEREPLRDEVLDLIEGEKPSVLVRKKLGDKILNKIIGFVETFINGITN